MKFDLKSLTMEVSLSSTIVHNAKAFLEKHYLAVLLTVLSILSVGSFITYYLNGLGVAYTDSRSHLDMGRRVVESLKPGFSQLGSVWLPLPHLLMTLTVWNDFMWHSGLAGALQSMGAYVFTGVLVYLFLRALHVGMFGRIMGVLVFATNINILYLQSTAMTELLLLGTMTAGAYELMMWHKDESLNRLIKTAFWIMLSTLIRYDGWFLFLFAVGLIFIQTIRKHGYKTTEGKLILFCTLGGFGIFLWLLWNQMIFKDMFYFAYGPFSANAQQDRLEAAGTLLTKKNLPLSLATYVYALIYNVGLLTAFLSFLGMIFLWFDKKIHAGIRIATTALLAPFFFNVLALYLGHSALYVEGLSINSWFNVRYGLMMVPSIAVFTGYLMNRTKSLRFVLLALFLFVTFFTYASHDAVTIDDAVAGASGQNVTEVSSWLKNNALHKDGYVLTSTASHDAIIFSSGLPMKRFIHEGTGIYWDMATAHPEKWARWIVLLTGDTNDSTYRILQHNKAFKEDYTLIHKYPFADIYEIKPELVKNLNMNANLVQK